MKKILIEKDEDIADAIDHILADPSTSIVLVVPRASALGRSVRNFRLLKREMDSAGRQIEIESVDEQILTLAKEAKIPGRHPLLNRTSGSVSDIVAVGESSREITIAMDAPKKKSAKAKRGSADDEDAVKITVQEDSVVMAESPAVDEGQNEDVEDNSGEGEVSESDGGFLGMNRFFKEREVSDDDDDERPSANRGKFWKRVAIGVLAVLAIFFLFTIITHSFGRANVTIDFVKTPWQAKMSITADKSVATTSASGATIPAQVFLENKNVTQLFQADGSASVSQKAQGTITIYNAYSSAPQTLVATTRFQTPSGLIFRLVNEVTVPGAQITNGQIVPSSINAPIVADQAGPSYNVGAAAKLTVPGFANSPKSNGFYGSIASGTTGGFVGTKAVPTATDIANAKASTTAILTAALQNAENFDIPANFRILDGATNAQIVKLVVNTTTDSNGNFSVIGQVSFQAIGFDESVVKNVLLAGAQATEVSSTFSTVSLSYATVVPNFTNGTLSFTVSGTGSLVPIFSPSTLQTDIAGMSIADARTVIAALPQLSSGEITVSPVWLWSIPANPSKINVTVE